MNTNIPKLTGVELPPQPWDLSAAKMVVAELERSGLTVAHFARAHNVTSYKIRRCQRLVDSSGPEEVRKDESLLSVRIKHPNSPQEKQSLPLFEIQTEGGLVLKFPQNICPRTLAGIMRNLMEASC